MRNDNPIGAAVMKWIITVLLAIVAVSFTARAFAFSFPTHTATINYGLPSGSYYNNDMHLTWHKEPEEGWGMYAMYYVSFQAGIGAYTGLQKTTNPGQPKTAIFSVWDAQGRQTAMPVTNNSCKRFGHEGTGTMCLISFDWKADTEYKLRIWRILNSQTSYSEKWGAWVIDVKTGQETLIGVVELYNVNNYIGYGQISYNGLITVTEYFAGPANADCSNLPDFAVTWKGPYGNNGSVNPTHAIGTYNTGIGTQCFNNNNTTNEVFSTTQENGKNVKRSSGENTYLWGHYDIPKYNKLDCVFNWAENKYPTVLDQSKFKHRRLSKASFSHYYRDYRVDGKGSAFVIDTLTDKVLRYDSGGANVYVGNLSAVVDESGCK